MNTDNNIKAILIDLDGVLRQWPDNIDTLEKRHGLDCGSIAKVAFSPDFLQAAIRGAITDAEWRRSIATELRMIYPDRDAQTAVDEWTMSHAVIDVDVLTLVSSCKRNVLLVLTTNATTRLQSDLHEHGILTLFDHIINSSDIGLIKPESDYFMHALEVAGVTAEQTLFIDDSLENVTAATALGISGHHFKNATELELFLASHGLQPIQ